jgi:hypothetical protein
VMVAAGWSEAQKRAYVLADRAADGALALPALSQGSASFIAATRRRSRRAMPFVRRDSQWLPRIRNAPSRDTCHNTRRRLAGELEVVLAHPVIGK